MKNPRGKIAIIILTIVAVATLAFLGLIAYNIWQIKYGDSEKLAKQFRTNGFTMDASRKTKQTADNIPDVSQYIRNFNPTLGKASAPITILAFIDFECPFSRQSYPIFKKVMETYGPVIHVIFKNFPIADIHANANSAANAAACANEQGKFWDYYDRIFTEKTLDTESLRSHASAISLDMKRFDSCLSSAKYQPQIDEDLSDTIALKLRGTPTYIVNGKLIEGSINKTDWDSMLLPMIRQK